MVTSRNPYLKPQRLADVIAAITAMGSYRYYKLSFSEWADRIGNDREKAGYWGNIFAEHPEFFRINPKDQRASLVWRRQHPKTYEAATGREITVAEFKALPAAERDKYTRKPLGADEVCSLIEIAVSLHQRSLDQRVADAWWLPLLLTAVLAFLGSTAGVLLTD